jgi:protein TonB
MLPKKSNQANLERKRSVFLLLGALVTLSAVLMAFEHTTYVRNELAGCPVLIFDPIEEDPIPIVLVEKTIPTPPPPKVKLPSTDFKLVDDLPVEKPSVDAVDSLVIKELLPVDLPPEIIPEGPILVADQMPTFPGGDKELFKFLADNIQYPRMAADAGISGRVYVTFVVSKDGTITDVKLLKGLAGGCSEEAIRVLGKMPRWSPGWHQGKLVSVQYNLPINFLLK